MAAPTWFTRLAKTGRAAGIPPGLEQESRTWYFNKAKQIKSVNVNRLIEETPSRLFTRLGPDDIGSMTCFFYDAKLKATLPYWDQFPLIFPIEDRGTSFLGINLHYLPLVLRARLMNDLLTQAVTENNKIKRLNISYQILRNAARFGPFKPCLKQYLKSHLKSRFFYIRPEEWFMAIGLPTQRFVGASAETVWADSRRKIRGD